METFIFSAYNNLPLDFNILSKTNLLIRQSPTVRPKNVVDSHCSNVDPLHKIHKSQQKAFGGGKSSMDYLKISFFYGMGMVWRVKLRLCDQYHWRRFHELQSDECRQMQCALQYHIYFALRR